MRYEVKSITVKSISGYDIVITATPLSYDPSFEITSEATHKEHGKLSSRNSCPVTTIQGKKVVDLGSKYINKKIQNIYFAIDVQTEEIIKAFLAEIKAIEKDRKENWIELNLGICFNSDLSCHWWKGDRRTPFEQILAEGKKSLSCCHKPETHEESIRKAYEEHMQKQAKKEERKKEIEALYGEAKRTGQKVKLYTYTDECRDKSEECSLDIITVYAMPDGTKSETRSHT